MKLKIHTTGSFTNLENILKSKTLKLCGSDEMFYLNDKKVSSAAHPMVCFSEYDIDRLDEAINTYGRFAIAFSDDWIRKRKVHQVLYVERTSLIAESFANLLKARRLKDKNQLPPRVKLSIMQIKCFVKNAKGKNSHFKVDNYPFKDENEWRFVPSKADIEGKLISQSSKIFKDPDKKNKYNKQWEKYSLRFDFNDIEMIFVETEEQRHTISNLTEIDMRKIRISNWSTEREIMS